jgi:hypothetical protein
MAGPGVAEAVAVWVMGVRVDVFVRVGVGVLVRVCVGVGVGVFGASGMSAETPRMLSENTSSVVSNKLAMVEGLILLLMDYL